MSEHPDLTTDKLVKKNDGAVNALKLPHSRHLLFPTAKPVVVVKLTA
jgi:hypothetical protein